VARLARSGAWVDLPARALLDGGSVAPRVRRLLEDEPAATGHARLIAAWLLLASLPVAVLLASREPSVLRTVQRAAEVLVQAR
jgi:hypothetical protein